MPDIISKALEDAERTPDKIDLFFKTLATTFIYFGGYLVKGDAQSASSQLTILRIQPRPDLGECDDSVFISGIDVECIPCFANQNSANLFFNKVKYDLDESVIPNLPENVNYVFHPRREIRSDPGLLLIRMAADQKCPVYFNPGQEPSRLLTLEEMQRILENSEKDCLDIIQVLYAGMDSKKNDRKTEEIIPILKALAKRNGAYEESAEAYRQLLQLPMTFIGANSPKRLNVCSINYIMNREKTMCPVLRVWPPANIFPAR